MVEKCPILAYLQPSEHFVTFARFSRELLLNSETSFNKCDERTLRVRTSNAWSENVKRLEWKTSEGESHCEVEGEVALEVGMDDREVVVIFFVGRIDGFHATVEAEDEIVEVESQAQAIADRYL